MGDERGACRAVERKPKRVTALEHVRIVQVAIGGWHCLALDDNGQVVSASWAMT